MHRIKIWFGQFLWPSDQIYSWQFIETPCRYAATWSEAEGDQEAPGLHGWDQQPLAQDRCSVRDRPEHDGGGALRLRGHQAQSQDPEAETKALKAKLKGGIPVMDLKKGFGTECEPGNKVDMFYEGVQCWIMTDNEAEVK